MQRLALSVLFIILCFSLFGGELKLSFKHYSVDDGLSQNSVHAIFQDSYGFMWFGTDNGLNKFDGYKFTVFQNNPLDSSSIKSNLVVDIFEDSNRNLWIGNSYNGLNLFDRKTETFRSFEHHRDDNTTLSSNHIRAIFEDRRGNLWIGTSGGGLNLMNKSNFTFKAYHHDPLNLNSIGSDYINSIAEDKNGNLWLASSEGVLVKFDPIKEIFQTFRIFPNYSGTISSFTYGDVIVDNENNVWFTSEEGLAIYNNSTQKVDVLPSSSSSQFISNFPVSSILQYDSDHIIIGTDHGGLYVYNKKTKNFDNYTNNKLDPKSISNDQIHAVYKDRNGTVWIGNYGGGINVYDPRIRRFDSGATSKSDFFGYANSVLGLCEDQLGNIWIGCDGQGVDILKAKTQLIEKPMVRSPLIDDVIVSIHRDSEGDYWFGTYRKGLIQYSAKERTYRQYLPIEKDSTSISSTNVWSFCEDRQHRLWVGALSGGINLVDKKNHSFTRFPRQGNEEVIRNNDVFKVIEDLDGKLLVGTRNGLNIFDPQTEQFSPFPEEANLFGAWVHDIFIDSKKTLWVGTDLALNRYDRSTHRFTHFIENDGLKGNSVLAILEDNSSNIWFSTNKGISRFNTADNKFTNFDVSDGLQSREFNAASCLKATDGKMYFGGLKGFNCFYPDSVKGNPDVPPLFLTDIKIFNKSISVRDSNALLGSSVNFIEHLTLDHRQSVISFEFAALNFLNSSKNQYAYYLEGFDKGWNYINNKREVTYTNLNAGSYIFHIKGSNNDGIWNEKGKSIAITVLPPFYKTEWFYFLEFLLLLGSIYSIVIYREKKLVRDKVLLQQKVDERTLKIELQKQELERHRFYLTMEVDARTIELKAAKEKAEESDQLKSAFLANMSHEIRTPMNAIVGFANLLGDPDVTDQDRKEFIELINVNSVSLLALIEDILDLSRIEANQLTLKSNPFKVNVLLEEIRGSVLFSNNRPSVEFRINNRVKELDLTLNCDMQRIKQILINLINNALKFTDDGFVNLEVYIKNDRLILAVSDTGIGIHPEDLPHLFERFRKFASDGKRQFGGTGLGLAISQRLAKMLGGEIIAKSEFGEGSTFTLILPLQTH